MTDNKLKFYRRLQRAIAIERDNGLCAICFFKHSKKVKAQEVHHVYGRNKKIGTREHYTCLLCVCRDCHPQPITSHVASTAEQEEIVDILHKANEQPINKDFRR